MQSLPAPSRKPWLTPWERAPARKSMAASAFAKLHSAAGSASYWKT